MNAEPKSAWLAWIAQPSTNSWCTITSAVGINDSGAIVGTANYNQIPYAPVPHGVMLLPCQFRLLNGSTNTADVDGMDFNGNRPTTVSGTSNYVTATVVANDIGDTYSLGNDGIDVLGIDTPLGRGRPILDTPFSDNSYLHSLMMLAKVSPPAATNITYGWNRVYQARGVTIAQTSTNTWYVNNINLRNGIPVPRPDHTNVAAYETVVPSTNNNVVAIYDDPGIYLGGAFSTGAAHTNDYAYLKDAFTYSLTNSIGTASVVATQQVGLFVVAKRTGTSGVVTNDWTGVENVASTTNIPDCSGVTVSEIRAIVYPSTNAIILDPSVTNDF